MPDTARTIALIKALGGGSGGGGSSGGGVLVVNSVDSTLDKTWAEINASTVPVVIHEIADEFNYWGFVTEISIGDNGYCVFTNNEKYVAETENDYPVYDDGGGGPK